MRATVSGRRTACRRTASAGLLALLLVVAAACGSSSKSSGGSSDTTAANNSGTSPTTVSTASLLGAEQKATGTPVKVGLITNGGACNGCGNKDDEPVARATVDWVNEHMNGLAGHPIDLVVCVDGNDPGKTADCANQMISDDVAAVIIGTSGVIETTWKILHDAKIPMINVSTTNTAMLADTQSTYILNDPGANTIAFPIGVAKQVGAKKVSVIVIDVPAATDIYKTGKAEFTERRSRRQDHSGRVGYRRHDAASAAGLRRQSGWSRDDRRARSVLHPGDPGPAGSRLPRLDRHDFAVRHRRDAQGASQQRRQGHPVLVDRTIGIDTDPGMRQYNAVLDTYAKGKDIDRENTVGIGTYQSVGALAAGTKDLTGEVTPASVNAALHSMKNATLLASGAELPVQRQGGARVARSVFGRCPRRDARLQGQPGEIRGGQQQSDWGLNDRGQ